MAFDLVKAASDLAAALNLGVASYRESEAAGQNLRRTVTGQPAPAPAPLSTASAALSGALLVGVAVLAVALLKGRR